MWDELDDQGKVRRPFPRSQEFVLRQGSGGRHRLAALSLLHTTCLYIYLCLFFSSCSTVFRARAATSLFLDVAVLLPLRFCRFLPLCLPFLVSVLSSLRRIYSAPHCIYRMYIHIYIYDCIEAESIVDYCYASYRAHRYNLDSLKPAPIAVSVEQLKTLLTSLTLQGYVSFVARRDVGSLPAPQPQQVKLNQYYLTKREMEGTACLTFSQLAPQRVFVIVSSPSLSFLLYSYHILRNDCIPS